MTSTKKHISYKPAQVAKRRTTDTPVLAPRQGGGVSFPPSSNGMDRMVLMVPPGTQYTFTFLGAHGKVTLRYPLDADPSVAVETGEPGKPVRLFSFERCQAALDLMNGGEGEGQG